MRISLVACVVDETENEAHYEQGMRTAFNRRVDIDSIDDPPSLTASLLPLTLVPCQEAGSRL
jgi:hypothetical protein